MRTLYLIAILALSLVDTALAQTSPPPTARIAPQEAHPGLWVVRDDNTTIYLFGTVHALPPNIQWRTARLERALAEARELVLEAESSATRLDMSRLMADEPASILERVPAQFRENLRQLIRATMLPVSLFDQMETWGAALLVGEAGIRAERGEGVEAGLTGIWQSRRLPIRGLETTDDRVSFLNSLELLPETAQRAWLTHLSGRSPAEVQARYQQMLRAWMTGDVQALAQLDEFQDIPAVRDILVIQRNLRWARWLAGRLRRPGKVFVAVGSAHLAGERSVQQFLTKAGLRVERIQ